MRKLTLVIAIILILAGVIAASYPLYLKIQSNLEQQRLEREFQE